MATFYIEDQNNYIASDYFDLLDGARVVLLEARIPLIVQETVKKVRE